MAPNNSYPYVPEEVKEAAPMLKNIATAAAFPGITAAKKLKDIKENYNANYKERLASGNLSLLDLPAVGEQEIKEKYINPLINNFSKGAAGPGTIAIKKIVDVVRNPNSDSKDNNKSVTTPLATTKSATFTDTPTPLNQINPSRSAYNIAKGNAVDNVADNEGQVLLTNIGVGNEGGVALGDVQGTRDAIQKQRRKKFSLSDVSKQSSDEVNKQNPDGSYTTGFEDNLNVKFAPGTSPEAVERFLAPVSRGATFAERGIGPAPGKPTKAAPLRELYTKENSNLGWKTRLGLNKQILANEGSIATQNLRNVGSSVSQTLANEGGSERQKLSNKGTIAAQELRNQGVAAESRIRNEQARVKQEAEQAKEQLQNERKRKENNIKRLKNLQAYYQSRIDSGLITPEEQTKAVKIDTEYERALSSGKGGAGNSQAQKYLAK